MGLENFIIQDDKKLINKILSGTEKFKKHDKSVSIVATKFFASNYNKLGKKELANLSTTARELFHFINKFSKLHNIRDEISNHFVDDPVTYFSYFCTSCFFQLVCSQGAQYNN